LCFKSDIGVDKYFCETNCRGKKKSIKNGMKKEIIYRAGIFVSGRWTRGISQRPRYCRRFSSPMRLTNNRLCVAVKEPSRETDREEGEEEGEELNDKLKFNVSRKSSRCVAERNIIPWGIRGMKIPRLSDCQRKKYLAGKR